MGKVKRIAAKSLAKEHKKMMSTQNSERYPPPKEAADVYESHGPLRNQISTLDE
jgi:hypothetical protein